MKNNTIFRKTLSLLLAALTLSALFCTFATACSSGPRELTEAEKAQVITFKDPAFEAEVRKETGWKGDITRGDALTVTELSFYNSNVRDISDVAHFRNLTKFYLCETKVSDISALKDLVKLEYLYLYNNRIEDISALRNLKNLTQLEIGANNISDISVLGNLTNLTELGMYCSKVKDIGVLRKLTKLTRLAMATDSLTDVSVICSLKNLEKLTISGFRSPSNSDIRQIRKALPNCRITY